MRYFGLPSTGLFDVSEWRDLFSEFIAVERGALGQEWEMQHELELQAYRLGMSRKVKLLRGDIDALIVKGRDSHRNRLRYPYDVISLDYSGGLFYQDKKGNYTRLKAISTLIERQCKTRTNFVLLVSCNLDELNQGEIRRTLQNFRTELVRYGSAAESVMDAYMNYEKDEARLKLYLPYFVNQEAAKNHYNCHSEKVIFYAGNRDIRMMAFRFFLVFDGRTEALRQPQERMSQILNRPLIEINEGVPGDTTLGLPKLEAPISERREDGPVQPPAASS